MVCATVMMVMGYLRAISRRQERAKKPLKLAAAQDDALGQEQGASEESKEDGAWCESQVRVRPARQQRATAQVRRQRLEAYTTQMRSLKEMGLAYQVKQPTFSRQFNLGTMSTSIAGDFDSDAICMSFASSGKSRGDSSSSSSSSLDGEKGVEPREARDFESHWHGTFGESAGKTITLRTGSGDSATSGLDTISE